MPVNQSSVLNKFIEKMDQAQQQGREIESIAENNPEKIAKRKQLIVTAIDALQSYLASAANKEIILPQLEIFSLSFLAENIHLLKNEMKLSNYQLAYGDEAIKLELYIKQRVSLLEDCQRSRKLNGEVRNLIINVQEDPFHRIVDWKALGNYRQELKSIQRKVERHLAQKPIVKTFNLLLTNFSDKLKNKPAPVLQQEGFSTIATVSDDKYIKDIYAIDRVLYYLELSSSVILNTENELNSYVIERALQVVGEYIKNTKDSPHISQELENTIKALGIPYERVISLRNILSHIRLFSFEVREKLKHKKIAVFKGIQRDLKKMIPPFAKILYKKELNKIKDRIETVEFDDVTSSVRSIRNSLRNTIYMQSLEEIERELHTVSKQMHLSDDQFLRNKKSLIDDIILNIQLKKTRKMITEFESIKLASDDFPKMIEEIKYTFTPDTENLLAFLKMNRVTPSKSTITAISKTKNIEHFSLVTEGKAPFSKEDKSEILYDYFIEDIVRDYLPLYKAIQSKLGSELFMVEFDSEVGVDDDYALLREPEQKSELDLLRAKFKLINHLSRDKAHFLELLTVLDKDKETLDYNAIHQFSIRSELDDLGENSGNLLVDLLQQFHQTIQFYESIQPEEIFDDYLNGFVAKTKSILNNADYEGFSQAVADKKKLHQVKLKLLAYCDDVNVITEEEYKEYIKVIESDTKQSISPKNEKFPLKKKGKAQLKKNLQRGIKDSYLSILKAIKEEEQASKINNNFVTFIDALKLDFSTGRLKEIAKDYVVSSFEVLFCKKIQDLNLINQAYINGESKGHDKNIKIANEMLLLDISNIWISLVSMYKSFNPQIERIGPKISLLLDIPPVRGFVLRNYLAHGDALVDVLRPDLLPKLMHNIPNLLEDTPFLLKLLHLLGDDAFLARDYLLEIASDNNKLAEFSAKALTIPAKLSKYSADIQQLQQWSRCSEYLAALAADKTSSLPSSSMTRVSYRDRVSEIVNSELREAVAQSDLEKIEYCFASDLVDITATDELGWNLGFFALEGQNIAVFDRLKQKNVKLEIADKALGSPIHYLILQSKENDFSLLDIFLENSPNALQATNKQGFKASHFAAIKGDVSLLKKIQARDMSISERTDTDWTPLLLAIVFDHTPSVNFLITQLKQASQFDPKTDLMLQGKEPMTGLYLAIENNNPEMLNLLLKNGAQVDQTNAIAGGFSPLHRTVFDNNEPLTRILLDNNANVNVHTQGEDKITPLQIIACKGYLKLADIFFSHKNIDINLKDTEGKSAFAFAIANRHHDLVKKFLALRNSAGERRVDINVKDNLGNTPVYQAVRAGDISTLNLLLSEEGLDINVRNLQGWPPSLVAVAEGRLDMLKALKDKGADLSLKISNGGSHLQLAKRRGYPTIVEYLLIESKEEILAENKKISNVLKSLAVELSALDFAALIGDNDAIGILIEGGANLFTKNNSGSVLHKAIFGPDPVNTLDFIIRKMKDQSLESYKKIINAKDSNGNTALLYAIQLDKPEAMNVLLAGGADPILKNNVGKNELAIASCLPGPSTARRRKRNVLAGCEISWEDLEKFSEEKGQVREFDKIKVNSAEFLAYYQDPLHSEIKREQLLQLVKQVPVIGSAEGKVTALINQHESLTYLQKVGRISGLAVNGILAKNILRDFLQHNDEGVAINVGFFSGGIFAGKMAGVALKTGEKFIAEGANFARAGMRLTAETHLMLGQSLKLSAPFLARATSVFIVYDLVNQIKAYQQGDPDALVGIVGDGIYIGIDGITVGVEVAELFGLLEGVSAYTGPIGATIGAVIFVGTDIYLSIKQVNKEDALIHLSNTEKLTEFFRAFIGRRPESHIENLMGEKQGNNELIKQRIDYLKNNKNIQRYIAPTAKVVGEVCHTINYKPPCVVSGIPGQMQYCPPPYLKTGCSSKLEMNSDSTVLLDYKRNDFKWGRAKPDVSEGNLFCVPTGDYERVPGDGAYFCDKAMGIEYAAARTGNATLIALGHGNDTVVGFPYGDHVVILGDGHKNITLGNGNDTFSLMGNQTTGFLDAGEGINTLDLRLYAQNEEVLFVNHPRHLDSANPEYQIVAVVSKESRNQRSSAILQLSRISDILLRKNKRDFISVACNTRYIDSGGGRNKTFPDAIVISAEANCTYDSQIVIRSFTNIENYALESSNQFSYIVSGGNQGEAKANLFTNVGLHQFLFNYTLYDLNGLERNGNTTRFSFIEIANAMTNGLFTFHVIGNAENTVYRLRDDTEIKIGETGIYALQLTSNSVAEIINAYPRIAAKLDLSLFVQSQLTNETIAIGHGKHDVLPNDPYRRSHLIGNGGENIFVISSGYEVLNKDNLPIPEVVLYDVDAENLIDTLDLREIRTQLEKDLGLTIQARIVLQDKDIILELFSSTNSMGNLVTIRLENALATHWHKRLHILNPLAMELDASELKPIPLEFGSDKDIIIISPEDVEKNTKLIIPKTSANYYFIRLNDNLIITNALDSKVAAAERYTLSLQRFYQEPKLKTLSIKFLDKELRLKDEQVNIENAGNYKEVYEQYNRTTHNWIFGKNVPEEGVVPFRFGHYKASNQLVMEPVPQHAPLIGHPKKEANGWKLSNYMSWSALLAGGVSFVSGALLVGGYFGYRNRLSRTRGTYLPVNSISSSSQALATTAMPLLTMGNKANAQAAVPQEEASSEQPALKEAGNQHTFKKAKDLKIMVDGDIMSNAYLAKWLFHMFGKRAVVNRMNKAEQTLTRNTNAMSQFDCIQAQLKQGIDTYGSKKEKIEFRKHQRNRTIASPATIVSEKWMARKDTASGFLQLPSALSNLKVKEILRHCEPRLSVKDSAERSKP